MFTPDATSSDIKFIKGKNFEHRNNFVLGVLLARPSLYIILGTTVVMLVFAEYLDAMGKGIGRIMAVSLLLLLNTGYLKKSFFRISGIIVTGNIDRHMFTGIALPLVLGVVFFVLPYPFVENALWKSFGLSSDIFSIITVTAFILILVWSAGWAVNTSVDYSINKFFIPSYKEANYRESITHAASYMYMQKEKVKEINAAADEYYSSGDVQSAIKTLEEGIESTYYNADLLSSLIECQHDSGYEKESEENIEILKRLDIKSYNNLVSELEESEYENG